MGHERSTSPALPMTAACTRAPHPGPPRPARAGPRPVPARGSPLARVPLARRLAGPRPRSPTPVPAPLGTSGHCPSSPLQGRLGSPGEAAEPQPPPAVPGGGGRRAAARASPCSGLREADLEAAAAAARPGARGGERPRGHAPPRGPHSHSVRNEQAALNHHVREEIQLEGRSHVRGARGARRAGGRAGGGGARVRAAARRAGTGARGLPAAAARAGTCHILSPPALRQSPQKASAEATVCGAPGAASGGGARRPRAAA